MYNENRGFTLLELMVTLAIAAILVAIAVPNFTAFLQNSRLAGRVNEAVTMMNYARSEAVKRNGPVTVCSRASDTACANSTNWDDGILVFADADGDGAVGDVGDILQVMQSLGGDNTLRSSVDSVTYRANGVTGANASFRLCDERGTESARTIDISTLGRVATTVGADSCP